MSIFPTKVLLATDGSKEADLADRSAAELADETGSELHVVHVLALPIDTQDPSSFQPEVRRQLEERARARVDELVGRIGAQGGEVAGSHLRVGRPDAEIIDRAEEIGAGLIVMGSRSIGPIRRVLTGSVSDSVVRHDHCPVVVVRGGAVELPTKILLATDGSEEANLASSTAADLARSTGSELHIVYVEPASYVYEMAEWESSRAGKRSELERAAKEMADSRVQEQEQKIGEAGAQISGTGYEPAGSVEAGEESLSLLRSLARAAIRCSTGRVAQKEGRWIARGDPMEAALDVFARRLGIDVEADEASVPVTKRFPFDPRRRRMSVVVGDRLFVKGAPDSVCPRCLQTKGAHDVLQAMTERGLRVIAVASRPAHGSVSEAEATETELELLGLIGLEDPPRPHAAESVAACREAGIRVAMITGDHPATAEAIARDRPYRAGLHGPPGTRTHWGRVGDENLSFVDTPPDSGVSTRPPRPASQVMDHSSLHSSCDRAQLPNAWIMTSLAPFAFSFTRCWWCNASTPGHALRSARPGQLSIGSTERTTCMPAAS